MDKQKVPYLYSAVGFSLKKERNSEARYDMDEHWGRYAKGISQGQKFRSGMILPI